MNSCIGNSYLFRPSYLQTGATRSRRLSSSSTSHPYNLPPTPSGRRRPIVMEPTNQSGHHSGLKYYIRIPPEYLPSDNKSDPHTYKPLVRFRLRKAAEDGVVIKVAANKTLPTLEGYGEDVFGKTPERFLHIRMMVGPCPLSFSLSYLCDEDSGLVMVLLGLE